VGNVTQYALQMLRNQIGQRVYPVHRLDSKTSGILLFATNTAANIAMQKLFAAKEVAKQYLAIVRGYTSPEGTIDYPLKSEKGVLQEAVTHYKTIATAELAFPSGIHTTSRYSLVEIMPLTGRMHQIRRHFAHIMHPVIGDRPHGCNKQNKFFKEQFGMNRMLLHAGRLSFRHPCLQIDQVIESPPDESFLNVCKLMGWYSCESFQIPFLKSQV
jgi:tRNA pseudouridine65 synthase